VSDSNDDSDGESVFSLFTVVLVICAAFPLALIINVGRALGVIDDDFFEDREYP